MGFSDAARREIVAIGRSSASSSIAMMRQLLDVVHQVIELPVLYRRNRVPSGTYFFTVNLLERRRRVFGERGG